MNGESQDQWLSTYILNRESWDFSQSCLSFFLGCQGPDVSKLCNQPQFKFSFAQIFELTPILLKKFSKKLSKIFSQIFHSKIFSQNLRSKIFSFHSKIFRQIFHSKKFSKKFSNFTIILFRKLKKYYNI